MFHARKKSSRRQSRSASHSPRWGRVRLLLSALEDRCVPAQFTVMNTLDGPVTMAGQLPGSLRQAIFDANANAGADEIIFDATFATPQIITLSNNEIAITDGLTITGPGQTNLTISGAATAGAANRIFNINVAAAATITMSGVTLANGNLSAGNGGGILAVDEVLDFSNVTLSNNRTVGNGGGIAMTGAGAKITFTNCSLIENSGTASTSTGGAINVAGASTITVNTSLLERNSAGASGGAINAAAAANVVVNAGSTFSGNSVGTASTTTGGAINLAAASTVTINAATFRGNLAGGAGGAIHTNATSSFTVNAGAVFDNNSVVTTGTNAGGGAISLGPVTAAITGTATITGATFINNRAPNGGALRIGSSATSSITVNTSLFTGNRSTAATGGAISMSTSGVSTVIVKIDNSSLVNNEAATSGGAIAMNNQSVTIRNSTLSGNAARSFAAAGGGAIVVTPTAFTGALNIYNSTITNNMAPDSRARGGGIYIARTSGAGAFLLSSTILAGNSAATGRDISGSGSATIPLVTANQSLIGAFDPAVVNVVLTGGFSGSETIPVDPGLLPLGHYGGSLPVHGLQTTSKALNAGNDSQLLGTDQRGVGFPRTIGTADIGAIEGEMLNPYGQTTLTDVTVTGPTYSATVVYADNVGVDSTSIGADDVLLSGPGYGAPVSPTSVGTPVVSGNTVTVTYTFTAPGSSWDSTDNGFYTLSLVDGAVLDTGGPALGTFAGPMGTFRAAIGTTFVVDNNLTDTDDGNYGAGQLTLREAIALSDRTNVGVADNITFNAASANLIGPIVLATEIVVNDSVNIVGLGQSSTSISGNGATRIFNANIFSAFGSLNISQLTLLDGRVTATGGGAILLTDDFLNLDHVTLTNNTSQGAAGGAIQTLNADARVSMAFVTAGSNTTSTNGGVIATSSTYNYVTINNSTFTMNTAGASGGVLNGSSSITLSISNCTFSGNTATSTQGGAMNLGNGVTSIVNCLFSNNSSGNATTSTSGALALVSGAIATIGNSTFTFNTTTGDGGVFQQTSSGTKVVWTNCIFNNNSANRGGVALLGSTYDATFNNCVFNSNSATGERGGVFYAGAGNMTINSSSFSQNSSAKYGGVLGSTATSPAIYTINDSTFTANSAIEQGGAFATTHTSSTITINNSLFSANTAGTYGGAIGSSTSISINATNTTFVDNQAGTSVGGAIGSSAGAGTVYTIDDCKFLRNSGQTGGALYAVTGLTYNITDTLFQGNRAHSSGALGGGAIRGGGGNATYGNCTFSFNTSASNGGAVSHSTGPTTITVDGCIFNDNSAAADTGALGTSSGSSTFTITNSQFLRNRAGGGGGALTTVSNTVVSCKNSVFDGNSSLDGPGGVWNFGAATVTLENCSFTNNFADRSAGVLHLNNVKTSLTATDCTFDSNVGGEGGAIRSRFWDSTISLDRCTFSNNQARMGGALAIGSDTTATTGGTVTVNNCTMSGNKSTSEFFGGGAISIFGALWQGTVSVRNSTIVNNSAVLGGGIFDVVAGDTVGMTPPPDTVNIYSSIVANNSATKAGNDLYFAVPHNVTLTKSLIGSKSGSNANLIGTFDPLLVGVDSAPVDPGLYHLANNGGFTKTHALKVGSPAIDVGDDNVGLSSDQVGGLRLVGAGVDIGSFEGTLIVPIPSANFANVPPAASDYIATVIYEDETGIDVSTIDITDINITSPVLGAPMTPYQVITIGSGTKVTANYYFTPPGGSWDVSDNGTYTVNLIGAVKDTDSTQHTMAIGAIGNFIVGFSRTFKVDIIADEDDGNTGPGDLSLREAIKLANSTYGSHDIVTFDGAVFGSPQIIALAMGQITITDSVTIQGPGTSNVTIDAGMLSRHFEVSGAGLINVNMSGMKLINGKSATFESGGGLRIINANVNFSKMEISSNSAADDGGAFSVVGNSIKVQVVDSVIANNISSSQAGGIHVNAAASLVVTRSTISGNSAANDGGGIYFPYNGSLVMDSSTVSGNVSNSSTTGAGGGGIYFYGSVESGAFRITNSTISGNSANQNSGGGINLSNLIGNVVIENSTITGNNAQLDGGGLAIKGVGVFALTDLTSLSSITLRSTIVANNSVMLNPLTPLSDIASYKATTIAANNNLIGIQDATTSIALSGAFNQVGDATTKLDAGLDPNLALNGAPAGSPFTHALLPGSKAIDAGLNLGFALSNDQRGPGFQRSSNDPMTPNVTDATDIGAFEIQFAAAPPTVTGIVVAGGTQRSLVKDIKVSFSEPVTLSPGAFGLKGYALGPIGDVELSIAQAGNDVTITFKTGGGGFITLDPGLSLPDGQYELTINADKISGAGGNLDGNKNGNYDGVPADNVTSKLHRLFGDGNGDGAVTAADFNAFRLVYGSVGPSIYDFDASDSVTAADFNSFRLRYGASGFLP